MPLQIEPHPGIADYARHEEASPIKHEYRNGRIIPMPGSPPGHSLINANLIAELGALLKGKPCRVYDSNLRIRIPRTILYTYPDASVICGQPQLDPDDPTGQSITNPTLIVEVLSPTTESYDRGDKFNQYLELESLQEYVLVSPSTPRIEILFRQPSGDWLFTHFSGLDSVAPLRSLQIRLPLSEIYAGVEFPPPAHS